MVNEQLTPDRRDEGSIGIGAMIVFIALILVAAVASTIIIKTCLLYTSPSPRDS